MHDAIVVGGGPVGSQIAYLLSGAGYDVTVLEKKSDFGEPVCCTGIISRECVSAYNIDNSVILRALKGASLISPGGMELRVERPEIQAYVVDRGALNALLARRAQSAGARFLAGCTFQDSEIKRDFVSVSTIQGSKPNNLKSRCLVNTSGFNREEGGNLSRISDFTMGAQAEVELNGIEEVEVYLGRRYAPGFFAWLVPTSNGLGLAGLMARRNAAACLKVLLADLVKNGKIKGANQPGFRPIPLKPSVRTHGRRVIVAGGAAGQVKPLTGGGIYYGLVCAEIASRTLTTALADDDLSSDALSAYSLEWRRRLGREIKTSYLGRKLFELLSDRQIDRIFEIAREQGIIESYVNAEGISFDRHSEVVKKLIHEKALSSIWSMIKLSFLS